MQGQDQIRWLLITFPGIFSLFRRVYVNLPVAAILSRKQATGPNSRDKSGPDCSNTRLRITASSVLQQTQTAASSNVHLCGQNQQGYLRQTHDHGCLPVRLTRLFIIV